MNQEKAKRRENFYIHSSIVVGGTCHQLFRRCDSSHWRGESNRSSHQGNTSVAVKAKYMSTCEPTYGSQHALYYWKRRGNEGGSTVNIW